MALVGREEELLAQLHALLFLPSPVPAAPVKVESAGGRPNDTMSSCGGRRRRRRQGSKRDRDDDSKAKDEQHDEDEPTASPALPHHSPSCKRRKKKQQRSKSIVTSVPDFDGYQWRKYGQKQIEGAMYPRSYYRCTRSAEQGCQAKRTVQRNNDDCGDASAAAEYTVVYVAEHTCTANDSLEAPVILETTIVVVPSSAATSSNNTNKGPRDDFHHHTYTTDGMVPSTSAGSCSTITTGTGSPAISSDDVTCWSSSGTTSISDYNYAADDYYSGELFAAVAHGTGWATRPADSAAPSSLQEMEDLTGPIRSPVHVPVPGWTIDQLLMQLVNEPVCHF